MGDEELHEVATYLKERSTMMNKGLKKLLDVGACSHQDCRIGHCFGWLILKKQKHDNRVSRSSADTHSVVRGTCYTQKYETKNRQNARRRDSHVLAVAIRVAFISAS
jgi:hypothetical protein